MKDDDVLYKTTCDLQMFEDYELCENKSTDGLLCRLREFVDGTIVKVVGTGEATGLVLKDKWVLCGDTFGSPRNPLEVHTIYGTVVDAEAVFGIKEIGLSLVETQYPCSINQTLLRKHPYQDGNFYFRFQANGKEHPDVFCCRKTLDIKVPIRHIKIIDLVQGSPIFNQNGVLEGIVVGCYRVHGDVPKIINMVIGYRDVIRILKNVCNL